ncbi:MAG: hypothetical protein ACFCU5_12400 [Pleurocapsa sp.]
MRSRARRKNAIPGQNLDSFLDILTNTVGVLMFISLFVTLIAVESDAIIQTPLASETKKTPRFFELREGKLTYIDDQKVGDEMEKLIGNLPSCNQPDISPYDNLQGSQEYIRRMADYRSCVQSRAGRLVNFKTETDYYYVTMTNPATFSLLYEPIPTKAGEDKEQIALQQSVFNGVLQKLNPNQEYLAFIVRPDSFATFRAARKQAWEQGFEVGWEPHSEELPITFGSGGRAIGVQ